MKDTLPARARFAEFELDLRTGELHGGGQTVRLTEKPFRVLMTLVEHGGELVSREEIQKKLWPNDTIVDFEHGINAAIKTLRRVLGDSADQPKYIETFARRGYRLMVPVERMGAASADSSSGDVSSPDDTASLREQLETFGLIGKKVSHYAFWRSSAAAAWGWCTRRRTSSWAAASPLSSCRRSWQLTL
jgi:eukaryotic-like serine/threonine-protein kinase